MSLDAARLADLTRRAEADLQAAAGGAAVCTLTRAGTPAPAVKYAEGRWAALREVDRTARRQGTDLLTTARDAAEAWTRARTELLARGAGPDWLAYRAGGIDALTELVEADGTGSAGL